MLPKLSWRRYRVRPSFELMVGILTGQVRIEGGKLSSQHVPVKIPTYTRKTASTKWILPSSLLGQYPVVAEWRFKISPFSIQPHEKWVPLATQFCNPPLHISTETIVSSVNQPPWLAATFLNAQVNSLRVNGSIPVFVSTPWIVSTIITPSLVLSFCHPVLIFRFFSFLCYRIIILHPLITTLHPLQSSLSRIQPFITIIYIYLYIPIKLHAFCTRFATFTSFPLSSLRIQHCLFPQLHTLQLHTSVLQHVWRSSLY